MRNIKRPVVFALLLLVALPLLSGCWDMTPIDDRNMVTMLAINLRDGQWTVRSQVLVPRYFSGSNQGGGGGGANGGGGQAPFTVFSGQGRTYLTAMQNMEDKSNRLFDFSMLRVVVLGRGFAKTGVDSLDPLLRDAKIPSTAYMTVAATSTRQILSAQVLTESLPSHYLHILFSRQGNSSGAFVGVMLWQFLRHRFDGGDAFAPLLSVGKQGLQVNGLALFKGPKLDGQLSPAQTATFNLVHRSYPFYQVSAAGRPVLSFHVLGGNASYGVSLKGGGPSLWVRVVLRGNIADSHQQVRTPQQAAYAEGRLATAVRQRVKQLIFDLQRMGSDPIGFREKLREEDMGSPFFAHWKEEYPHLPLKVTVRVIEVRHGYIF